MKGDSESGVLLTDQNDLVIWTVYWSPKDYPGEYVARAHVVGRHKNGVTATEFIKRGQTLKDIHDQLPLGLICFPRSPDDDPVIVESWM